jgi:long-chain acyl-CoA synthetase
MKLTVPADAPNYPTILHALEDVARRTPDRTALICEGRSVTFADHRRAVSGVARRLQQIGVENERVAILMTNCLEFPMCVLGAMAAHAYVAPMNPNYTDSELLPLLQDADPKVIVTLPEFFPRVSKVAAKIGVRHVLVVGEGSNTVSSWVREGVDGLPRPLPDANDHAMMFFTGGTTGLPKGAEHRHRHIMAFCRLDTAFYSTLKYDKEVSLSVAPMFHIFGHHHAVIHPLYIGSTHVIICHYKPAIVLQQLSEHKVTVFAGGPSTVYVGILAAYGSTSADLSHLRICMAGASPFSEDLLANWAEDAFRNRCSCDLVS